MKMKCKKCEHGEMIEFYGIKKCSVCGNVNAKN